MEGAAPPTRVEAATAGGVVVRLAAERKRATAGDDEPDEDAGAGAGARAEGRRKEKSREGGGSDIGSKRDQPV